jgi:hypothetical protein
MPPRADYHNSLYNLVEVNTHTQLQQRRESFNSSRNNKIKNNNSNRSNKLHNRQPEQQQPRLPRVVSFHDEVSIVEFPYTLGDNPACSSGAPITMDWTPQCRYNISLQHQQQQQQQRRQQKSQVDSSSACVPCRSPPNHRLRQSKRSSFALTAQQRYDRLVQSGVSPQEIRQANRQRQRLRQQRKTTVDYIELDETIQMFVTVGRHTKQKMVQLLHRP